MRDLDRLKEVREYRVTGPQLAALVGLGLLVVVAAFVAGFEAGLWQRPIDEELMRPAGGDGERDAGEVLAALLAERPDEEAAAGPPRMAAPPLASSLKDEAADTAVEDDSVVAPQPPAVVAGNVDNVEAGLLIVADDTRSEDAVETVQVMPVDESTPEEPARLPDPEPVEEPRNVAPSEVAEQASPASSGSSKSTVKLPGPPSDGTGFTVQLAAYPSSADASKLINDLRAKGFDAFHQEAVVDGQTWYRVRVGVYSTRQDADDEAHKLSKASPFDPFVTSQP